MGLSLKIENMTSLPDGGPLGIEVPGRSGLDIGRDQHLDWTLPDPTRFISGKHCEIRYKDGAYWLHDVSSNGTFLNGAEERMRSPHRLRTGDRLEIGDYLVAVTVDLEPAAVPAAKPAAAPYEDLWQIKEPVAPPMAIRPERAPRREAPATMDFLDRLVETSGPVNDALWNDAALPPRPAPRPAASVALDWSSDGLAPARSGPMPASSKPVPTLPKADFGPFGGGPDVSRRLPPEPAVAAAPAPAVAKPAAAPPPPAVPEAVGPDFVRLVARGAGVPEAVFARYAPAELAEELGALVRMTATNLQQLLSARSELKDVVRSTSHTTIVRADNNPLKFSPNVEEAIRLMFAPTSSSYLDAPRTFAQSFNDLKQHQGQTFAAMQGAIGMIQRDLDPKSVEADIETEGRLGAIVGSRKARLWDAYVARWRIGIARRENGLLGVFLDYFAASYDKAGPDRRGS